jgi:chromosome segregation ATPase
MSACNMNEMEEVHKLEEKMSIEAVEVFDKVEELEEDVGDIEDEVEEIKTRVEKIEEAQKMDDVEALRWEAVETRAMVASLFVLFGLVCLLTFLLLLSAGVFLTT